MLRHISALPPVGSAELVLFSYVCSFSIFYIYLFIARRHLQQQPTPPHSSRLARCWWHLAHVCCRGRSSSGGFSPLLFHHCHRCPRRTGSENPPLCPHCPLWYLFGTALVGTHRSLVCLIGVLQLWPPGPLLHQTLRCGR